jgi:uncharacterized membrane protein
MGAAEAAHRRHCTALKLPDAKNTICYYAKLKTNMAAQTKKSAIQKPVGTSRDLASVLPWLLLAGGLIAMAASIMLSVEVFDRLKNPHYVPICNLNPILSCTSVADSPQSHLFGFPNYFIGIAGYAAVSAFGAALLSGAKFKRRLWRTIEAGLLFAIGFLTWLQFETIYRIGALCIFCMIVWAATIPMFWYTTLYNFRQGNLNTPRSLRGLVSFAQRHHGDVVVLWFAIIIVLILKRFWYYWSTLI